MFRKSPYRYYQSSNPLLSDNTELDVFLGKPFYCNRVTQLLGNNNQNSKLNCCFNHMIGLPEKHNKQMPLFDYQLDIVKALSEYKHIIILKATALGISELLLRYMAYLCVKDNKLTGSQMCIVTGPRLELAVTLMNRLKGLFYNLGITFSNRETVLDLNGVRIEAYPSHHLDTMRGLSNVSFILQDEADFFPVNQQQDARKVSERYIAKSNPWIVLISTPNAPEQLFDTMLKEEPSMYHKIKLHWMVGRNKIYSEEEIKEQMKSPSWQQEYCLKFLGQIGNLLTPQQVDNCIRIGGSLKDIPISQYTQKTLGVDFGYSSSKTGIILTEFLPDHQKAIVRYSTEIDKGDPNTICDLLFDFHRKYWNLWYLIDGSAVSSIRLLKIKLGESLIWDPKLCHPNSMKCVPVNFSTEHKQMLQHMHLLVSQGYVGIPSEHQNLITGLRTAWAKEWTLDKEVTSFDDSVDALRLSLKGINIK